MSRVKNRFARVASWSVLILGLPQCMISPAPSSGGCDAGQLACGDLCCPDDTHYACASGQCTLIGCDDGYQLCGTACIPLTADCCSTATGDFCQTGEVCCAPSACIPIGTSCCGNGDYCAVGKVCCNGGTQCC